MVIAFIVIKSAAGYLRHELGSRIDLRYTPELQFFVDDSIAYGAHILDMLNHVKPADPRKPISCCRGSED